MGGEPTFVSIDDYQAAEWNTAAVGPTKRDPRRRSDPPPARALRAGRFPALRPGQMVSGREPAALDLRALLAQGRQADLERSEPDRHRMADPRGDAGTGWRAAGATFRSGWAFRRTMWSRPMRIPRTGSSRKPSCRKTSPRRDSKLDDPEARARIARVFERGLTDPSGFILPVQRWQAQAPRRWASEKWPLRRGKMFLVPGDSPVGFRLPLASLPYVPVPPIPSSFRAIPARSTRPCRIPRS